MDANTFYSEFNIRNCLSLPDTSRDHRQYGEDQIDSEGKEHEPQHDVRRGFNGVTVVEQR